MIIHCPFCNTEYDCEPGKYECECGAKFSVTADGNLSVENSVKPSGQTVDLDLDKTIPPQRERVEPEPDAVATIPGRRDRTPDGRFEVGDLILRRYKVLSELGQGGMGVVYKCLDETAGVVIALKAIPPELSRNTIEMEDVKDNFQLVSKLVHQNIAISKNLEKDNATGNYYLIMECVEGEDLRRWIKRKRRDNSLTVETILPIIRQVAVALDYAHEEKIIHRDIKPSNIMIDAEGRVKVLDFGLAAQIHTSMTRVSMAYHGTSGTAPYMAPEQWRGRAQGAAADQYALAVMTYEVFAGNLPFDSADVSVLREAVLNESAEPIPGVSPQVQQALMRAMSKNPTDRFCSCADFVAALGGEQVSVEKRKEEVVKDAVIQIPSYDSKLDKETAIKRISILMEQQEWDKARSYCEKTLDSDPENPELYLILCLIEHKVTNESMLLKCNCDLSEDKFYSTAISFASPERRKQLLEIQSTLQQDLLQQYEFYIQKCMDKIHVSDVTKLSKNKMPLAENIYFQMAKNIAPVEQKKVLLHLQEEQENNTSSLKRIWKNTKEMRRGGLQGIFIGMLLSPIFLNVYSSCIVGRISFSIENLFGAFLGGIPVGYTVGAVMEVFWNKCYKHSRAKRLIIAWSGITGALLGHMVFMILVYIDGNGWKRDLSRVFSDYSIIHPVFWGIPFGLIWSVIWYRKMNNRKKKAMLAIQDAETEYILQKKKEKKDISKEDEQTLNLLLEKQKQKEKRIIRRKRFIRFILLSLLTIALIGVVSFIAVLIYRACEFDIGKSAYKEGNYSAAAIHLNRAYKLGYNLNEDEQFFLGKCYYNGTGISKDYSKAIELFESPAYQGRAEAQFYLGECYINGYGSDENTTKGHPSNYDVAEAVNWYYKAATQGLAEAQFRLGMLYHIVYSKTPIRQLEYIIPRDDYAILDRDKRNLSFDYNKPIISDEERIDELAIRWIRKAAVQGHADAQFYLGKCYENGECVNKDFAEAMKWYRKAAENGHDVAKTKISIDDILQKSKDGNAEAQYELGNCYFNGNDVKKDISQALKWYQKAAEQGHPQAKDIWEQYKEKYKIIDLSDDISLIMVKVEAGSFEMGVTAEEEEPLDSELGDHVIDLNDWLPQDSRTAEDIVPHLALVNYDFYIGQTEVTQGEWMAVMHNNPSSPKQDDCPVSFVSWDDAMEFCDKLNKSGKAPYGWKFTLPTETQWEYAARGGKYSKGYIYCGSNSADEVSWYFKNYGGKIHSVGQKKANELGLYDMGGNVEEWCLDKYENDNRPVFVQQETGPFRVVRGGCVNSSYGSGCSPASRNRWYSTARNYNLGFRLALVLAP